MVEPHYRHPCVERRTLCYLFFKYESISAYDRKALQNGSLVSSSHEFCGFAVADITTPSLPILDTDYDDGEDWRRRKVSLTITPLFAFAWPCTSARQCDVLSTAVPRHLTQIGQPPRQQLMADADACTAARATGGGPAPTVTGVCFVHQWRSPTPWTSSTPPPAPPTPPPEFNIPLSLTSECPQPPATPPSPAGFTSYTSSSCLTALATTTLEV